MVHKYAVVSSFGDDIFISRKFIDHEKAVRHFLYMLVGVPNQFPRRKAKVVDIFRIEE